MSSNVFKLCMDPLEGFLNWVQLRITKCSKTYIYRCPLLGAWGCSESLHVSILTFAHGSKHDSFSLYSLLEIDQFLILSDGGACLPIFSECHQMSQNVFKAVQNVHGSIRRLPQMGSTSNHKVF